jgi:hypothetical protein
VQQNFTYLKIVEEAQFRTAFSGCQGIKFIVRGGRFVKRSRGGRWSFSGWAHGFWNYRQFGQYHPQCP